MKENSPSFELNICFVVWKKSCTEPDVKNLSPIVKYGGGDIMVQACMPSNIIGNLHIIDRIMSRFVYLDILKACGETLQLTDNFISQQDKDPKQITLHNVPRQILAPPQSLNSIQLDI